MKKLIGMGALCAMLGSSWLASNAFGATATQSGNWSDSATWGGSPPSGVEEDVVIPAGIDVLLDTNVECGELLVNGRLEVQAADRTLTCDSLIVQGATAEFAAGTNASRFINRFVLTLKGETTEQFSVVAGGNTHNMGARALLALMGGTINLHGEDRVEWTHLGANASAGANTITMAEPVDWAAGDEILICTSRRDWNESERKIIASVSGDGLTVTLTSDLAFPHAGVQKTYTRPADGKTWTADLRAEVGLLSRNITIQGAADSATSEFGAHVMIHGPIVDGMTTYPSGQGFVKGVELFQVGQKSLLGRYPYHWHLNQDSGAGQYFSDNAVHTSFNRAITIHGTDFLSIENNFFYDHIGHGVFLEDAAERFNVIRDNVVALTRRPAPGEEVIPSDNSNDEFQNRTPASFWITNPNNTIEDNVVAGTEGTGYWLIFPQSPLSPAGDLTYYSGLQPNSEPLGSFARNKAHSTMNGFDIFDQLEPDHGIRTNKGWFDSADHVMDQCTWYANETAVYTGDHSRFDAGPPTNNLIFRDNVFVDNTLATAFATYNRVENSVFVADSGENLITGLRFLWRLYDGAASLADGHLVGWDGNNVNAFLPTGAAINRPNHDFSGITTDHTGTIRAELPDFDIVPPVFAGANSIGHPRFWQHIVRNTDGSLTGQTSSSAVSNHPFLLVGDETRPSNWWNMYVTNRKYALLIDDQNHYPDLSVTRTKSGTKAEYLYYINGFDEWHEIPVIVNDGFLYTYTYTGLPASQSVTWAIQDADPGDAAIARFLDFGNLSGLTVSGSPAVAYGSVNDIFDPLSTDSGYFVDGQGDLYLRFVAQSDGLSELTLSWTGGSIPYDSAADTDADGMTNAEEGGPFQDTDGDGVADYLDANSDGDGISDADELDFGLNPYSAADLRFEFGEHGSGGWWGAGTVAFDDVDSDGAYEVVDGGGDPYIQLREEGIVSFSGNLVPTIQVRYRAEANGTLQLFFANELGPISASRMVDADTSYVAGSGFVETTFNVGAHPEWAGRTITQLRLDTISAPGTSTWVDWIRAGNQGDLPDNDFDDDGLTNDEEEAIGTDPNDPDTDNDGVSDFDEVWFDGDGAYNPYHPIDNPTGTDLNATVADTDGDGVSDGHEITFGSNPLDANDAVALPISTAAVALVIALLAALSAALLRRTWRS